MARCEGGLCDVLRECGGGCEARGLVCGIFDKNLKDTWPCNACEAREAWADCRLLLLPLHQMSESYNNVPLTERPHDGRRGGRKYVRRRRLLLQLRSAVGAQQRLAALKAKLGEARKQNHKAVVAEDRREKMGEAGLKAERQQKAYEKKQAAEPKEAAARRRRRRSSSRRRPQEAWDKLHKREKKEKRGREGGGGWDVFNNEAQYRHHKKQIRRAENEGRAAVGVEGAFEDEGDADPLAYGQAPPIPKERVQALVEDMHEAALRRASWSRRRTFDESADVTHINKRNEVFNKKIERAFDPYMAEIKANLERGTAL